MEIKVKTSELLQRVSQVAQVVNTKNSIQILSDILFELEDGILKLTASDADMWVSVRCDIIESDGNMDFCVNATDMLKSLKNLGDVEAVLALDGENKTLTCNYGNGEIVLPYDAADEYPSVQLPEGETVVCIMESVRLSKAIELSGFATANSTLRPILNGINFQFRPTHLVCVSLDGQKLVRYQDSEAKNEQGSSGEFTLLKKPCSIAMSLLSDTDCERVKVKFNNSVVVITNRGFRLVSRLLEWKYPAYERFIPKESECIVKASFDREQVMTALKRVLPLGEADSQSVMLTLDTDCFTVSAGDARFLRSAKETVAYDSNVQKGFKIGFNGSLLLEELSHIDDDTVVMELTDEKHAGVFYAMTTYTRDEYVTVLMPMVV